MKILVPIKRVSDPHAACDVRVIEGRIVSATTEYRTNPFDEAAVEAALRLTENASSPKVREGEVIVATIGPTDAEPTLRAALACGANRAIHIEACDEQLDASLVARALSVVAIQEKPDLILVGRKTVDCEGGSVGAMLASRLNYPMVSLVTRIVEGENALLVRRETEGIGCMLRVRLPAVISVDLRVTEPRGATSRFTAEGHEYYDGVRFAALPAVMQARKKELRRVSLEDMIPGAVPKARYLKFEGPPPRTGVTMLNDAKALAAVLGACAAQL